MNFNLLSLDEESQSPYIAYFMNIVHPFTGFKITIVEQGSSM